MTAVTHRAKCTCWICDYKKQFDDAWEHYGTFWDSKIGKFERDADHEDFGADPSNDAYTIAFHDPHDPTFF